MNETASPPYASGDRFEVVVPSDDPAKCLVWGSMWVKDSGDSLATMGYEAVRCKSKTWSLLGR
ncbi:MAG TPA: hypothetical protein VJN18_25090 [Polyangiaceae bacterium]|nr:hypothetical protein [Polyangiaceae bacterium]